MRSTDVRQQMLNEAPDVAVLASSVDAGDELCVIDQYKAKHQKR